MQKRSIIVMFVLLFAMGGCTTRVKETTSTTSSTSSKQTNQQLRLVAVGEEASCTSMVVQDQSGDKIKLPSEIEQTLDCATDSDIVSPNNQYLLYDFFNPKTGNIDLKIYDFSGKNTSVLMSFNKTQEGLRCIWRDDSKVLACVSVDQENYSGLTKVFVLEINDKGVVQSKKVYPQKLEEAVNFTCGSTCDPGDFWFASPMVLQYQGHEEFAPGKTFTISIK